MTRVLSADWVLPVAGAPIERGAVAFDGGRIAGFGDGRPFGRWLRTHIERKARIGVEEFLAIARLEAAVLAARGREERPDALAGWEALELATLGAARALHLEDEIGSLGPGSAPTSLSSRSPGRRTCPGKTPPRRSFSGGRPTEFYLPSSTARSATGKEGSDGTSFVAAQAPRAHACSTEKRQAQAPSQ